MLLRTPSEVVRRARFICQVLKMEPQVLHL